MKSQEKNSMPLESRRDALRKTGKFAAPVIATFTLANITVAASGQKFSDWASPPEITK